MTTIDVTNSENRGAFITAYVLARAGAISGSVTAAKLVASAAKVWQELRYEVGAEERPVPEAQPLSDIFDEEEAAAEAAYWAGEAANEAPAVVEDADALARAEARDQEE